MAKILKGNIVSARIKEKMKKDIKDLKKIGKIPLLAIIRLGNNPDDISYEKSIIKNCETIGIESKVIVKEIEIATENLVELIEDLNNDSNVSGILLFRPLPKHIDDRKIREAISVEKDVDCMHPRNLEKIFEGNMTGFQPGTPKAAMEILLFNEVPLEGAGVVVVNRSMVVGKPLLMMLLEKNATVTVCHSKTRNLAKITKNADIVITALGKAKIFDNKYFNEKAVIIDIGMGTDSKGNLSGDVDFSKVHKKVKMITPVPGGIGGVTTSILLSQVIMACKKTKKESKN